MFRCVPAVLCFAAVLEANGIIVPPPPPPRPFPPAPRLVPAAMKDVTLRVAVRDQVAVTEVEEIFVNPNDQPLEGTFILPIPPDAQVNDFTFFIDGKEVKGELLPRDKAQQYYQEIVSRMIDPGLLEYMDKGLVRVKLFPIPPRGEAKVRFSYSQILASVGDQLAYYYPFGTNKFSSAPLNQAVVDVAITSSVPLKTIYSPRYEVDVARRGEKEARVGFERKNFRPEDDFVLYIGRNESDFGVTALAHRAGAEDGYFLLVVSPKQEFGPAAVLPKDIVFVLDVSGSMAGEKLSQAKEALSFCVRSLGEQDRFNVVSFSTQAQSFAPQLSEATEAAKGSALAFIGGLQALGGTNIDEALALALKGRSQAGDRPFMVVFLTDGQPTVGATDPAQIVANVAAARTPGLRLFVFGVGDDVNTLLLDRLAEENRGTRQYVRPRENLEVRVSAFYQQIARPVLTDVELTFSRGGVYDVYPPRINDIFYGRQVILTGRYRECGEQALTITGSCAGTVYNCRFPLVLPQADTQEASVPRLWATRKIGYLLDEIRLHGQKQELVDEVTTLAKRFGIVTPYTSYFVHDDKALTWREGARRTTFATPSAENVLGLGGGRFRGSPGEAGGEAQDAAGAAGLVGAPAAGAPAVDRSLGLEALKRADGRESVGRVELAEEAKPIMKVVASKTFYLRDAVWYDSTYREGMELKKVVYLSPEYFALLAEKPDLGKYFALGKEVVACLDGVAYRVSEKP